MEFKKAFIASLIAIITLVGLTVGATYAFFTVTSTNSFSSTKINATIPDIGSVVLNTGNSLYLNLTRTNMLSTNQGTYYAVTNENGTATTNETSATIATANVTGEGTFSCTYKLNVAYTGTLKEALTVDGTAILVVNGTSYDLHSTNFPQTISGTLSSLTSTTPQNITAQFMFKNTNANQNALIDKSATLTFTATEFSCSVAE